MTRFAVLLLPMLVLPAVAAPAASSIAVPVELRGSRVSMERQHAVARETGAPFARTFADIDRMLGAGELVALPGSAYYDLRAGLHPNAARPEMRLFVERLAEEYFHATGEKLVVTSLARPSSAQPRNAHALSVHPTGLALDLRVSQITASRQWLETRLLGMEKQGLLDVTRERHPPHYHIALFPEAYLAHLEAELGEDALAAALRGQTLMEPEPVEAEPLADGAEAEETPGRRSRWSLLGWLFARFR